ncbi:MAG: FMN-binding protein [Eggerthellaceae bacterium]|nr:FMN-binding protein [Eggerthellaceae bacterium]
MPSPARTSGASSDGMLAVATPVVVLVVICAVAGMLLGLVHNATAPIAAQAAYDRQQQIYRELVPGAAEFRDVECTASGCTAFVEARDAQGSTLGYAVVAQAKGYSGQVPLAVAFDADGVVEGLVAMGNDETPGLGTRIAEEDFIGQFAGRAAQPVDVNEVDAISGATISSKAAIEAFNRAVSAYGEVV